MMAAMVIQSASLPAVAGEDVRAGEVGVPQAVVIGDDRLQVLRDAVRWRVLQDGRGEIAHGLEEGGGGSRCPAGRC